MKVEILFFAKWRELMGQDKLVMDVKEGITIRELVDRMATDKGFSTEMSRGVKFAIDDSGWNVQLE